LFGLICRQRFGKTSAQFNLLNFQRAFARHHLEHRLRICSRPLPPRIAAANERTASLSLTSRPPYEPFVGFAEITT
jgi:hypothetical protein